MTDDRKNLDDASAHYGLGHNYRDAMPATHKERDRVTIPEHETDADPELVGKSPDEMAAILEARASHVEGCNDPNCSRCNQVNERMLREQPGGKTDGGGSGGGRTRKKPRRAGGSTGTAMAHVYENEIERDLRPNPVSGRVSNDAYAGLGLDGVPNVGEILDMIGRALHRGTPWRHLADTIEMM